MWEVPGRIQELRIALHSEAVPSVQAEVTVVLLAATSGAIKDTGDVGSVRARSVSKAGRRRWLRGMSYFLT